jgi:adenine nucleotide transporter 17
VAYLQSSIIHNEFRRLCLCCDRTALYRGIGPVLTSVCCSNFVYFYTVYGLKAALRSHGIEISALKDLLMASIAGKFSRSVLYNSAYFIVIN